jgi:hypothetical protein
MKTLQEFLSESAGDEFVGIHYSHTPNLSKLHGSMSGTFNPAFFKNHKP